jgi:hypothetical protein
MMSADNVLYSARGVHWMSVCRWHCPSVNCSIFFSFWGNANNAGRVVDVVALVDDG